MKFTLLWAATVVRLGAPEVSSVEGPMLTLERIRVWAQEGADLATFESNIRRAEAEAERVEATSRPQADLTLGVSLAPGNALFEVFTVGEEALDAGEDLESVLGDPVTVSAVNPLREGLSSFEPQFRYRATVDFRWQLTDFGRTASARRAAELEAGAERLARAVAERDALAAADEAYLAWLRAEREVRLADGARGRAMERLQQTREAVSVGSASASDVLLRETEAARETVRVARFEDALAEARRTLEAVLGRKLPSGARPDPSLLVRIPEPDQPESEADAEAALLEARLRSAQADLRSRKKAGRPILGADAEVGLRGLEGVPFPRYNVGLSLTMPLLDGGARRAQRQQAQARVNALSARSARREAERERRRARLHDRYRRGIRMIEDAQAYLSLAARLLADTRERAAEGQAPRTDVDAAVARREDAETQLLSARLGCLSAALALSR
ncbi:MAG: TolC family protein [Myxococcota bacterium]